jgi:hypothetical protein
VFALRHLFVFEQGWCAKPLSARHVGPRGRERSEVVVMTSTQSAPSLLSVGLDVPPDAPDGSFVSAESAGRALELMKLLRFDLVVVSPELAGMSIPHFARQLRLVAPWQKWVLATSAGEGLTMQDELAARCNGALAVIDDVGDWSELLALAARCRGAAQRANAVAMEA